MSTGAARKIGHRWPDEGHRPTQTEAARLNRKAVSSLGYLGSRELGKVP